MKKPWKCKCGEWNWGKATRCEKCKTPAPKPYVNESFAAIVAKLNSTDSITAE